MIKFHLRFIFFIGIVLLPTLAWGDNTSLIKPYEPQYLTGSCVDRCHVNYMAYRTIYQGEVFRHNTHSPKQGLECSQCHNNDAINTKTHGSLVIQNKDCKTCHHKETNNEDCLKCHADVKDYMNGSIQNVTKKIPDWMFKAVSCMDCHKPGLDGSSFKAVREYCIECHNLDYGLLYDKWKETLDDRIKRLYEDNTNILNEGWILIKNSKTTRVISMDIQNTLRIVQSYGIHNFRLSQLLLRSIEQ